MPNSEQAAMGMKPNPDPTERTIQALQREISALKDHTRENTDQLKELTLEKFKGVDQKISDLIKLIEQTSVKDSKAVDAAFSAQKESAASQNKGDAAARDKAELSIVKLLEKMEENVRGVTGNIIANLNDLKSRIDRGEGQTRGVETNRSATNQNWGWLFGAVMTAVAIAALAVQVLKP